MAGEGRDEEGGRGREGGSKQMKNEGGESLRVVKEGEGGRQWSEGGDEGGEV